MSSAKARHPSATRHRMRQAQHTRKKKKDLFPFCFVSGGITRARESRFCRIALPLRQVPTPLLLTYKLQCNNPTGNEWAGN